MKRRQFILIGVLLLVATAVSLSGLGMRRASGEDRPNPTDQWEYLIVGGGNVNMSPTENSSMRKEPGAFAHEDFVLEGNLDKLGKKGWELITVTESRGLSSFIFKRRK